MIIWRLYYYGFTYDGFTYDYKFAKKLRINHLSNVIFLSFQRLKAVFCQILN